MLSGSMEVLHLGCGWRCWPRKPNMVIVEEILGSRAADTIAAAR